MKEAFEGASVADVARKTGRNYHTLRNHLKARRGVPVDLLIQFAAMTNCTLDWLATGEGPIYRTGTGKLGAFALDAQTKTEIRRQIIEVLGALALSGKDRGFDDSLLKEIGDRMREGITDAAP